MCVNTCVSVYIVSFASSMTPLFLFALSYSNLFAFILLYSIIILQITVCFLRDRKGIDYDSRGDGEILEELDEGKTIRICKLVINKTKK